MNLLTLGSVLAGLLIGNPFLDSKAHASVTHLARVEVELGWLSSSGEFESEVSRNLEFRLDWGSGKCELEYKGVYYYCVLNLAEDLRDRKGNVLMKQVPQAQFGFKSLDALLLAIGREDSSLQKLIPKIVKETSESRRTGFLLPFYTCEACVKSGDRVPVWNGFDSFVKRTLEIRHPLFTPKKLALVMKIHRMKALGGAMNIIGRSNADSFIEDFR